MKRASVSEAKNKLSALLDTVKGGASVLIVDRGRPVARLEPVGRSSAGDDRLERLIREGIARPARGPVPKTLWSSAPPRARKGASALRVLLDERREGR